MKELKGTQTEKNLQAAFAGESQAYNKYGYYASVAKKEGYEKVAANFLETSKNEKEHAKIWFKALHGGSIPDTVTNLKDAAAGEGRRRHHVQTQRKDRLDLLQLRSYRRSRRSASGLPGLRSSEILLHG